MSNIYKFKSLAQNFPFSIKFADMEPYYSMNHTFHWHNYLEISYVKQGIGRYYIENKIYDIAPGDIIVINNIEPHYMEVLPPVNMLQPVIMFSPQLIWSDESQLFDFQYLNPFFNRSLNFSNKIDSSTKIGQEIFRLLTEIEQEYLKQPAGYQLMIKAKLLHIVTYLIRHFQDENKQLESIEQKNKKLGKLQTVFDYIGQNFNRKLSLDELAGQAFMSANYLCAFFKETTGLTLVEYINKVRISRSIELLKSTDQRIVEIALECGFNNLANFNRTFKHLIGKTPGQIRHSL